MKNNDQKLDKLYQSAEKNSWICRFLIAFSIIISIVIIATITLEMLSTNQFNVELFTIGIGVICLGIIVGLVLPILFKNKRKIDNS